MRLQDITYFIVDNEAIRPQYIFLDIWKDTNASISSDITNNPIDALGGASLQDRRAVGMVNVQVSGAFSDRNVGRAFNIPDADILFLSSYKRLESIVHWFDIALENSTAFTVCKKGVLYHNQLLNAIEWSFDESQSQINVNFSFVEIEHFERAEPERSSTVLEIPQFPVEPDPEEEIPEGYERDERGVLRRIVDFAAQNTIVGRVVVQAVNIFRRWRR